MIQSNGSKDELLKLFNSDNNVKAFEGDALAIATQALVKSSAGVNARGVQAIIWMRLALGDVGVSITDQILDFKLQQSPGTAKRLKDAVTSISLREYMQRVVLNVGGGK